MLTRCLGRCSELDGRREFFGGDIRDAQKISLTSLVADHYI